MSTPKITKCMRSLSLLHPKISARAQAGLDAAKAAGHRIGIVETARSLSRQQALWNQGRVGVGAKIVTNAEPGLSWHHYGIAFDVAYHDDSDGDWTWVGDFKILVPFFETQGLHWLGESDRGHYERKISYSIHDARAIVAQEGLLAFWDLIDEQL